LREFDAENTEFCLETKIGFGKLQFEPS